MSHFQPQHFLVSQATRWGRFNTHPVPEKETIGRWIRLDLETWSTEESTATRSIVRARGDK